MKFIDYFKEDEKRLWWIFWFAVMGLTLGISIRDGVALLWLLILIAIMATGLVAFVVDLTKFLKRDS